MDCRYRARVQRANLAIAFGTGGSEEKVEIMLTMNERVCFASRQFAGMNNSSGGVRIQTFGSRSPCEVLHCGRIAFYSPLCAVIFSL